MVSSGVSKDVRCLQSVNRLRVLGTVRKKVSLLRQLITSFLHLNTMPRKIRTTWKDASLLAASMTKTPLQVAAEQAVKDEEERQAMLRAREAR